MSDPIDLELIAWIYESGYPYDWNTVTPIPEKYRRPLAEYAFAQEWPDGSDTETVDDWYWTMASEGNWP